MVVDTAPVTAAREWLVKVLRATTEMSSFSGAVVSADL